MKERETANSEEQRIEDILTHIIEIEHLTKPEQVAKARNWLIGQLIDATDAGHRQDFLNDMKGANEGNTK